MIAYLQNPAGVIYLSIEKVYRVILDPALPEEPLILLLEILLAVMTLLVLDISVNVVNT